MIVFNGQNILKQSFIVLVKLISRDIHADVNKGIILVEWLRETDGL
jgi:hypothetical protein